MKGIGAADLSGLIEEMGVVGKRMCEIDACEGAAGNLSICVRGVVNTQALFPLEEEIDLPIAVPELAGATFLVTGSGRRLREVLASSGANLACIRVNEGGKTGILLTSPERAFRRVTSEFNSHLAVHYDQMLATGSEFHAIVHAQPLHLTYLSHIARYHEEQYRNAHLLRWQPETILNVPEGIGFIPFCVPGSTALMEANVQAMRQHRLVIWAHHGVMARSSVSILHAADLVEYAETAAHYEYLNLTTGEAANGLNVEEISAICQAYHVEQTTFIR